MINYKRLLDESKNFSILLAEDYNPLRIDMAEVLENFFHTVTIAENGKDAWNAYQFNEKGFDIVLTDIQMPFMDGVELSAKILEQNPKQVIIVFSAHTDTEYLLKLINLGISKFITKPIQDSELFDTLYTVTKKMNSSPTPKENLDYVSLGEGYIWDKEKETLKYEEDFISLTKHEILLLKLFFTKEESICTQDDIMQYFENEKITIREKNIRNLVFKLRQKIPERCIQNIYGLGYKFQCLIEE